MVNIPPIPPLLCSTPPPIDFGEDDEELDVLPQCLEGLQNDDFCGFLADDDIKNQEPLPSPRLPSLSIYDGLICDDEGLKTHIIPPSLIPTDDKISQESKSNTKATNLTEAFNFNVKNSIDEIKNENKNGFQDEIEDSSMDSKTTEFKHQEIKTEEAHKPLETSKFDSNKFSAKSSSPGVKIKNHKDLTIQPSNVGTSCNSTSKTNMDSMQNEVSIEDIIDDLSDDELYSPKTPKNFVETDDIKDYFIIEEIKRTSISENDKNSVPKKVDSKSLDFSDNNNSVLQEFENGNEIIPSYSHNFLQTKSDMSKPLQDDKSGIGNDDDDDFGDFADFQETHFTNQLVPANGINMKQDNNVLKLTDLKNYDQTKEHTYTNTEEVDAFKNKYDITDTDEFESQIRIEVSETLNKEPGVIEVNPEISEERVNVENEADTATGENGGDFSDKLVLQEYSHKNNNFVALDTKPSQNEKIFSNFSEHSSSTPDYAETSVKSTENLEGQKEAFNDDEEFDDFADFESHPDVKSISISSASLTDNKNGDNENDDDDDDFGDFNTAEPIVPPSSNVTLSKTSHNIIAETPTLKANNLNERISKILQLMFTPILSQADEATLQPKTNKIQDIPFTAIDAAKALEYQWLLSDTRHSFIRSLGIDSRNILFGDNWNPSLPRFAANLSFNPLKPMKPLLSSTNTSDSGSMLEPIPINSSEITQPLAISSSAQKDTLDLNWKSTNVIGRTTEDFKDKNLTSVDDPPTTEAVSPTIFDNNHENEETFSKTPPISEMESVATFSSPVPSDTMGMDLPPTEISKNVENFGLKELEENLKNTLNINEVVVTSTFTGSFKETHIYTPPKTNDFETKGGIAAPTASSSSPTKLSPIDFDYEKAAMGVIIDETVVKKEYRDVEYNPPFSFESLSKSLTPKMDSFETGSFANTNSQILNPTDVNIPSHDVARQDDQESNDDFSEFQSVSSELAVTEIASLPKNPNSLEISKMTTVSHGGMILSPAILIPQAISMENQKPKIEWGDSTVTINPEELARIEELFPEPKSHKSSSSSQKSTPSHQVAPAPSISATVANKELENSIKDDDDDWSDFISVTVTNNTSSHRTVSNNNILTKSAANSPFKQKSPVVSHRLPPTSYTNSNNDDEWSEFVSSAPPSQQSGAYRIPQFNSGAWQNANFYNNPLSMYQKGPLNIHSAAAAAAAVTTHSGQKSLYSNNNNYSIGQQSYQIANNAPTVMLSNKQQTPNNAYRQQIHVMQNFSTAPVPTPERISTAAIPVKNNQFQSIGSAKVAPSIALIPDLGFVAPAIPTHTSFINSLPKPSINTKK